MCPAINNKRNDSEVYCVVTWRRRVQEDKEIQAAQMQNDGADGETDDPGDEKGDSV